jgi:hypothetical protein
MSSDTPTKPPPGPPPLPRRGTLGFGKLIVPPLVPVKRPEVSRQLASSPVHEPTKIGVAPADQGSYAPPSRSISPAPAELAPTPESARQARQTARDKVAESERIATPGPVLDSVKIEFPRAGLGAMGKWLAGVIVAALLGGGGAVVGSQTANPMPPAVLECPAQLEQLRGEIRQLRDRVGSTSSDVDEGRIERRRTDRKVEDLIDDVERIKKTVPRIEGVKPNN